PRSVIADTPANGFVDAPSHEPRELRPVARSTTCWYPNAPWSVQYGTPGVRAGLARPADRRPVDGVAVAVGHAEVAIRLTIGRPGCDHGEVERARRHPLRREVLEHDVARADRREDRLLAVHHEAR